MGNIISFFVYKDGIGKHIRKNYDTKYELVSLFPREMYDDVVKIAYEYSSLCSHKMNDSCDNEMYVLVYQSLSIKESSFAGRYGVIDE